jgi:serine/threonine protein kinase
MKHVILAEPSTLALLGLGVFLLIFLVVAVLGAVVIWVVFLTRKAKKEEPPVSQPTASTQVIPKNCPKCGASMPPDSPEGLCPRCLIALNLATQTEIPGEPGAVKAPPDPPAPVADVAKLFPQLEILECLGRGGMGAVYKARQPRLDRVVALKILSPEKQGNQKFSDRFEREARALAKLHHPNIVTVYDFGEVDGNFYLLMEFVDGLSLRQLLQSRKLSPPEALAIVPKICEALQYAHEQCIVHRDIKPENILMDKDGRVKIADFGIAKILGDGGSANLTAEQVIGTPHYMSPEQIEKPQTVDHRSDIYSLGVVFYEMLTGELPLGKFQPPSKKVQVDVRLDEIVLRALEKEPERRYQQASEVKTQLETIAGTPPETSKAAQVPPVQKPDHFWRRFAVVVLAIFSIPFLIAIVGMLAAIAIPAFIQGRQHAQALHQQELVMRQHQIGTSPFYIGGTWFPEGDSIEITSVERNNNAMTVKGHYNLVGHNEAALKLDGVSATPETPPQSMWISKGNGDFVLTDPNVITSRPQIVMYVNGLHPFASIAFGNIEQAQDEMRFSSPQAAPPADQGYPHVLLIEKKEAQQMCIANLIQIAAAKQEWALEYNKTNGDVPTVDGLRPYIQSGFPVCPDGGTYSINPIGDPPTCSIPGHALSDLNSPSNPAPTMTGTPGDDLILAEQPPVVVETFPVSGTRDVAPGDMEIRVRFCKDMMDGDWSWSTAWENSTPESLGPPHYLDDHRTCVMKVHLEPGKTYAWWLNSNKFHNFKDAAGEPSVPYLFSFQTKSH